MKNFKKIFFVTFIVIFALLLFSCSGIDLSNKVIFVVDGETYATIELDESNLLTLPDDPAKEGHIFEGWYWDKNEWDIPFYEDDIPESFMTRDMKVYARWTRAQYTVIFDGAGGNLVEGSEEQLVEYGRAAEAPRYERTGYSYTWDKSFDSVSESMVITAVWSIKTYTVTFNRNGGTLVSGEETQTIEHNGAATAPVFEKEGHTYVWDKPFDSISSNTSVTAVWTANVYNVTFNLNGGELVEGELVQPVMHGVAAQPPMAQRYGYTLSWDKSYDEIKGETVITAVWTINEYTVVFDGNGGELVSGEEEQVVRHGEAAAAPVYQKTGYTQTWGDAEFDSITGNMTISVVWSINSYTVIFSPENYMPGEHIGGELVQSVEYLSTATAPEFYRKGYTLAWDDYTSITQDTVIAGRWEINVYTVTFSGNQGSLVSGAAVQDVIYNTSATAPVFSRTGYTFAGWDKAFDAVEEDLTVTALWDINKYNVTFDGNGGNLISGLTEQEVEYGSAATPPVFEKTGYNLSWNKPYGNITDDTVITAVWTVKTYTVTFDGNGGDLVNGNPEQTVEHGQAATAPVFEKEGYNFTGWDAAFDNITDTLTVTAEWTIKTYTVTFDGNGGTLISGQDGQTVEHGSTPSEPQFELNGYAFGGWFTDNGVFENAYDFGTPVTAGFTVYAKWYEKLSRIWGREGAAFDLIWNDAVSDKNVGLIDGSDLEFYLNGRGLDVSIPEALKGDMMPYLAVEIGAGDLDMVGEIIAELRTIAKILSLGSPAESIDYNLIPGTTILVSNLYSVDKILGGGVYELNGVYFANATLIRYTSTDGLYTLPDDVTLIGNRAFDGNASIKEVVIPSYVKAIGGRAFSNAPELKKVTFTGTSRLNAIGESAFFNSANITSLILPLSIEKIGANAFFGATGLAVFAEADDKPEGWATGWNKSSGSSFATVVWGSVLSTDKSYVVSGINTYDGSGAAKNANPVRADYDFDGWYRTENFSGARFDDLSLAPNERLYAKWVIRVLVSFINVLPEGESNLLLKGSTLQILAEVAPQNAKLKTVSWSVFNDSGIATIDENGMLTAISPGTVLVKATANDKSATTGILEITISNVINITEDKCYEAIQSAINEANDYDTIAVAKGIYYEQLVVNKPLTLLGPNADHEGYSDNRGEEAVITYANDIIDTSELSLFNASSDNVTVKGFFFKNHQPLQAYKSQDEILFRGQNAVFENNRLELHVYKKALKIIGLDETNTPSMAGGAVIRGNYIEALNVRTMAVYLQGIGGIVENNIIISDFLGIQVQPYYNLAGGIVRNNEISGYSQGVWHNFSVNGSGKWTYQNNTITVKIPDTFEQYGGNVATWRGIEQTLAPNMEFVGNTIDASNAFEYGVKKDIFNEIIGISFYNLSADIVYSASNNNISNVIIGVDDTSGYIDLNPILSNNSFPEGFLVIGRQIKAMENGRIYVQSTGTQYATIQAAVDAATEGDIVLLGAGDYSVSWDGNVGLKLYKSISLIGEGENSVTIRPSSKGVPTSHRLVQVGFATSAQVIIKSLTINGYLADESDGGVSRGINVYNYGAGLGSSVYLENVTIQNIIDSEAHDTTGLYMLTGGDAVSTLNNVTIRNYGWTGLLMASLVGEGDQTLNINGLRIDGRNDYGWLTNGLDIRTSIYRNITVNASNLYIENCDYVDDDWAACAIILSPEAGQIGNPDVKAMLNIQNSVITNSAHALHFESAGRADIVSIEYSIFDKIIGSDIVYFGSTEETDTSLIVDQCYSDTNWISYLETTENMTGDPILYTPDITNTYNRATYPADNLGKNNMSFTLYNSED